MQSISRPFYSTKPVYLAAPAATYYSIVITTVAKTAYLTVLKLSQKLSIQQLLQVL